MKAVRRKPRLHAPRASQPPKSPMQRTNRTRKIDRQPGQRPSHVPAPRQRRSRVCRANRVRKTGRAQPRDRALQGRAQRRLVLLSRARRNVLQSRNTAPLPLAVVRDRLPPANRLPLRKRQNPETNRKNTRGSRRGYLNVREARQGPPSAGLLCFRTTRRRELQESPFRRIAKNSLCVAYLRNCLLRVSAWCW